MNPFIHVEENKTHTVTMEWVKVTGLNAEQAVDIKRMCERAFLDGKREALGEAQSAIGDLAHKVLSK